MLANIFDSPYNKLSFAILTMKESELDGRPLRLISVEVRGEYPNQSIDYKGKIYYQGSNYSSAFYPSDYKG